nr:uncharacterized protein LOC113809338 [Penaeus vannamei]
MATREASSGQAVTPQMATRDASSGQAVTPQMATRDASSGQAVTLQTAEMATREASNTQKVIQQAVASELALDEAHSTTPLLPQVTNSLQASIHQTPHLATEGMRSVQVLAEQMAVESGTSTSVPMETWETPQMTVNYIRAHAVIQQAATTDLGVEDSHSVFPFTPQEGSAMQAGVQQTSHMGMETTRHGQSETLQIAPGSLRETIAQSGVLHAVSSEVDLEEAPSETSSLIPKAFNVLSVLRQTASENIEGMSGADAVPGQTSYVTMEAGSRAESVMKVTGTAELDLEESHSSALPSLHMASNIQTSKQVTPYKLEVNSASTVPHQPSEVAMKDSTTLTTEGWETVIPMTEERVSNVQTITRLPTQMEGVNNDQEETCTSFAVTQAVASEVDMDESHKVASFLPHASSSVPVVTRQTSHLAMEGTRSAQTLKESPIETSQLPQVVTNVQERPYRSMEAPDRTQTVAPLSSVFLGLENPHVPSYIQEVARCISQTTEKANKTEEPQVTQAVSFGEHYNAVTVNPRASLKPLTFVDGEAHTPLAASTPVNTQTSVVVDKEQSCLEDSAYATATPTDLEKFAKETSTPIPEQKVSPSNVSHDTLETSYGMVGHQTPQTTFLSESEKKSVEDDSLFAEASEFSCDIDGFKAILTSNIEDEEKIYKLNTEMLESKPEQKLRDGGLKLPERNYREEFIVTSEEEFFSAEDTALASSSDSVTSMTSHMCHSDKNLSSSQVVHLDNRREMRDLDMQKEKSLTASGSSTTENLPCVTAIPAKGSETIKNDNYLYKKGHAGNIIRSCAKDPNVVVSSCSVPRVTLQQEVSEETYKEKEKAKQAERGEEAGRESSRSRSVDRGLKSALPGNIGLPHGNEGQPIASTNVIGQSALAGFGTSTKGPYSSSVTGEYLEKEANLAKLQDRDSTVRTSTSSDSQHIPVKSEVQDLSRSTKNDGKSGGKVLGKIAKGCTEKLENVVFHETSETNYSIAKNAKVTEIASLPHLGKFIASDTETKTTREDKAIPFKENISISSNTTKVTQRKEVKKIFPLKRKAPHRLIQVMQLHQVQLR